MAVGEGRVAYCCPECPCLLCEPSRLQETCGPTETGATPTDLQATEAEAISSRFLREDAPQKIPVSRLALDSMFKGRLADFAEKMKKGMCVAKRPGELNARDLNPGTLFSRVEAEATRHIDASFKAFRETPQCHAAMQLSPQDLLKLDT